MTAEETSGSDPAGPTHRDLQDWFDADYLYFYQPLLDGDQAERDAELILSLAGPRPPGRPLRILDMACGHGRVAAALARRGHLVTGVDLSETFLRAAREANNPDGRVTYLRTDMRALTWAGEFDVVVCFFSAFGYFGDDENRLVLANAARSLRPNGRFVLDLRNWDRSGTRMPDHDLIRHVSRYGGGDFGSHRRSSPSPHTPHDESIGHLGHIYLQNRGIPDIRGR